DDDTTFASARDNSASKIEPVKAESITDNDDTYYNRMHDNSKQQTETAQDSSDEEHNMATLQSTDVQDWKCRECGYVNEDSDTVCDTCGTCKPIRPSHEIHTNYSERRPSISSSESHSSSSASRNMYSRVESPGPTSFRQQNSSREQSPSKTDESDDEKSSTHSSVRSRIRRKSSQSYSLDDNQDLSSTDAIKQKQSPKNSFRIHSPLRDQNPRKDDYKSEHNNSASDASSTVQKSNKYGINANSLYPNLYSSSISHNNEEAYNQSDSVEKKLSAYPENIHRTTDEQREPFQSLSLLRTSKSEHPIVAYIPDLPINIDKHQLLENMIRQALELRYRQKVLDVKCNTELGIGVIYLNN
ncbi:unnamed protein product, partial [Adineta steineri]